MRLSSKAAGEPKPEAYPHGYVEDFDKPRTTLAAAFSSRQNKSLHPYAQGRRLEKLRGTTLI
jgi:hypothetical protein